MCFFRTPSPFKDLLISAKLCQQLWEALAPCGGSEVYPLPSWATGQHGAELGIIGGCTFVSLREASLGCFRVQFHLPVRPASDSETSCLCLQLRRSCMPPACAPVSFKPLINK